MQIIDSIRKGTSLLLTLALCVLVVGPIYAAVPRLMTYQGLIKDNSGNYLTGTYSMTFRIYSVSTGGTALWSETQSSVSASSGKFSVQLGSVTALNLDFNADYWLSIQVESDAEMSPRVRLTSIGYSIRSDYENNGFTQAQHDALSHSSIEGVKDNSLLIAKTNFKFDAISLAAANNMGGLIIDAFNDSNGINAGASSNYTYRTSPHYDVTLTPTGGSIIHECSTSCDGTNNTVLGSTSNSYNGFGQKFQLASQKIVDKATLKLERVGSPSGNVRVRLYASNSGLPGTLLAQSADIAVATLPTSATEITTTFAPTTLSASTDYHLVVENYNGSGNTSNYVRVWRSSTDRITGLMVQKSTGGSWSAVTSNDDMYFKLYEQQTFSGTATVVSNAYVETTAPTEAMVIADETLGTGSITYSVSRDNGTTWTQCTKETVTNISSQPSGTQVKWKASITGNAELNAIAVAV